MIGKMVLLSTPGSLVSTTKVVMPLSIRLR